MLIGSGGDDVQTGGVGNETIVAGAGNDTINGGDGIDLLTFEGAPTGVIVRLNRGDVPNDGFGGADTISGVENVTGTDFNDIITGAGTANTLRGGDGYDILLGLGGNDLLFGGSGAANELYGGTGNDTYYVDANDTIVELAGEGLDTIVTTRNVTFLADNLERLFFNGSGDFTATGNDENNTIVGGGGNDLLTGGAGYDVLIGGAGNDTLRGSAGASNELYGGLGDDTYIVEAYDTIVELAGQGTDTIRTSLGSFNLGANVENLIYTGSANFVGQGNALDNVINGRTGNDILTGGDGNDTLNGGDGLDTAVLRGVAADYTVTFVSGSTWTITDNVGGRDGVDTISNIERLSFSDGSFRVLTPLAAPPPPVSTTDEAQTRPILFDKTGDTALTLPFATDGQKDAFEPLVLPGVLDDDFFVAKTEDGPQVLPAEIDTLDLIDTSGMRFLGLGGAGHLVAVDESAPGGIDHVPGHDDWML